MKQTFAETLRRLRRDADLTQDRLAESLGVSPQTVSKWERAETYPDVETLPLLADIFRVSVDLLLGHSPDLIEEEIAEFRKAYDGNPSGMDWREWLSDVRGMYRKYPDREDMALFFCYALYISPKEGGWDGSPEALEQYAELEALANRLLDFSTDPETRNSAVFYLTTVYPYQKRYDKVKRLAETLPPMDLCRESVLTGAAEPWSAEWRSYGADFLLCSFGNFEFGNFERTALGENSNPEDCLNVCRSVLNMIDGFYPEKDWDVYTARDILVKCADAARMCLRLGRREEAVGWLKQGADACLAAAENPEERYRSPIPRFATKKRIRLSEVVGGFFLSEWDYALGISFPRGAGEDDFAELRETEEIRALRETLGSL